MAKLRSGILGNIRGKVAGVVGSQWKDKNYLREYVLPANPNTAAQQVQRTKMADIVAFCKALVGPVFNAYTDKFQKSMSGFNFFVKNNISYFDGTPEYGVIRLVEGKLKNLVGNTAVYDDAVDEVECSYGATLGNNGAIDDAVFAAVLDTSTGIWYFPAAEARRDDLAIIIPVSDGLVAANLETWIWAVQYSGTLVSLVSNSIHDQAA